MSTWHVKRNGKNYGPYSDQQLKKLAMDGKLKPDDMIRREDKISWREAHHIQGLFTDSSLNEPPPFKPSLQPHLLKADLGSVPPPYPSSDVVTKAAEPSFPSLANSDSGFWKSVAMWIWSLTLTCLNATVLDAKNWRALGVFLREMLIKINVLFHKVSQSKPPLVKPSFQSQSPGVRLGSVPTTEMGQQKSWIRILCYSTALLLLLGYLFLNNESSNTADNASSPIQESNLGLNEADNPGTAESEDGSIPVIQGRRLEARHESVPTPGTNWYTTNQDSSITSLECMATEDQLIINLKVDPERWKKYYQRFPLLVRLFDRNGEFLTQFVTSEGFTASMDIYEESDEDIIFLNPKGNRLIYNVSIRDLRDASIVNVSFVNEPP